MPRKHRGRVTAVEWFCRRITSTPSHVFAAVLLGCCVLLSIASVGRVVLDGIRWRKCVEPALEILRAPDAEHQRRIDALAIVQRATLLHLDAIHEMAADGDPAAIAALRNIAKAASR